MIKILKNVLSIRAVNIVHRNDGELELVNRTEVES